MRRAGLIRRDPLRPLPEQVRELWVTPEIANLLDGKVTTFSSCEGDLVVGRFLSGQLVQVSRLAKDRKRRQAKLIDVEELEGCGNVWVLCIRVPKPGWRLVGRLIQQGVFIALLAFDKHEEMKKHKDVATMCRVRSAEVIAIWNSFFGPQPAHSAADLEGFLGGVCRDVDEAI